MSQIEKLYEVVGIQKITLDYPDNMDSFYPEFTKDKQMDLIDYLINMNKEGYFQIAKEGDKYYAECEYIAHYAETLEESIAGIINLIWKNLTKEQQNKIRTILEEEK